MNYPFISILPLVDEVRSRLQVITKSSQFSDEDLYGWAVDAARLIGNASYETVDHHYVTVNKYICAVPEGFYLLNNVFLCEINTLAYTSEPLPVGSEPFRWVRSRVLVPADQATRKYCTNKCLSGKREPQYTYTVKCPPGVMRFGFHTGK